MDVSASCYILLPLFNISVRDAIKNSCCTAQCSRFMCLAADCSERNLIFPLLQNADFSHSYRFSRTAFPPLPVHRGCGWFCFFSPKPLEYLNVALEKQIVMESGEIDEEAEVFHCNGHNAWVNSVRTQASGRAAVCTRAEYTACASTPNFTLLGEEEAGSEVSVLTHWRLR